MVNVKSPTSIFPFFHDYFHQNSFEEFNQIPPHNFSTPKKKIIQPTAQNPKKKFSPNISLECIDALRALRAEALALAAEGPMTFTNLTLSSGQQERP